MRATRATLILAALLIGAATTTMASPTTTTTAWKPATADYVLVASGRYCAGGRTPISVMWDSNGKKNPSLAACAYLALTDERCAGEGYFDVSEQNDGTFQCKCAISTCLTDNQPVAGHWDIYQAQLGTTTTTTSTEGLADHHHLAAVGATSCDFGTTPAEEVCELATTRLLQQLGKPTDGGYVDVTSPDLPFGCSVQSGGGDPTWRMQYNGNATVRNNGGHALVCSGEASLVEGSMTMAADNPNELVQDADFKAGTEAAIAKTVGVAPSAVQATLTVEETGRRLRRLAATGAIIVNYVITVSVEGSDHTNTSVPSADDIVSTMASVSLGDVQESIISAVQELVGEDGMDKYGSVSVESADAPQVLQTVTITTTPPTPAPTPAMTSAPTPAPTSAPTPATSRSSEKCIRITAAQANAVRQAKRKPVACSP